MRKIFFVLLGIAFCVMVGVVAMVNRVTHGQLFSHGTSIHIRETEDRFEIRASYPAHLTGRLQHYIDARLRTDFFDQDHIDEYVTLDDRTRLQVKNIPGRLVIRLDKDENSPSAYLRVRELSAGIKRELAH